jgi:hypothetical protein
LLLIFVLCFNSLSLPKENIVRNNSIILLGQNQKSDVSTEYEALIKSNQDKVILVFHGSGKLLVNFTINLEEKTKSLTANSRILQQNSEKPYEKLDLTASIPEDIILAKLYQIQPFGVNVLKNVDLKRAESLPTKPRLEYLRYKTSVKTVTEAYTQFAKHLKDDKTEVFLVYSGKGSKMTLTRVFMLIRLETSRITLLTSRVITTRSNGL